MPEVLDPERGVLDEARLASARALEARVEGDDDKALLRQRLPVDVARGLLFAASDRVSADDRRIFARLVEARREMDIGGDVPVHVAVADVHGFHGLSPLRFHTLAPAGGPASCGRTDAFPCNASIPRSLQIGLSTELKNAGGLQSP
jgi:hypothetical protein